ncbi:MAG: hypothetical protein AAFQ82_00680 [Myxococcota bacterium]
MQDNVVSITSRLVPHSTVTHYFSALATPERAAPAPAVPVPQTTTAWTYLSVTNYFSPRNEVSAVQDVVLVKTGGVCSRTLGRLDNVFSDFGGAS